MFEYKATLVKVVDGDTIDIDIDLGFRVVIRQRCRLRGLNCPETRGPTKAAGDVATRFTKDWFTAQVTSVLTVRSAKPYADDKYGRFLVEVFPRVANGGSLNSALLESGNAVPFIPW